MKSIKPRAGLVSHYKTTVMIAVGSAVYMALAIGFNLDLFEQVHMAFHELTMELENFEGDEFILMAVCVSLAVFVDLTRQRKKSRREREISQHRMQVMRSTMATVQDVVNNFLNNLQLFRLEAERSQALNAEYLKMFDDLIEETAQKIKDIDEMEILAERKICEDITLLAPDLAAEYGCDKRS